MNTRTIGTTGADHVDYNAWVSYVQSNVVTSGNLTDSVTSALKAVGFSTTTTQTISGWAPNGHRTYMTTNSGDSWRDNAGVRTNAFAYNQSNGAFISLSGGAAGVDIQIPSVTISGLQIKNVTAYSGCIKSNYNSGGSSVDHIFEFNIFQATDARGVGLHESSGNETGVILRNNLFICNGGGGSPINMNSAQAYEIYDNTFYMGNSGGSHGQIQAGGYGTITVKGNVFFGGTANSINCRDANTTGSNNATDQASWTNVYSGSITGLTASQFNINQTNEIVDASSTPYPDFRLKTGGTQLQGTGVTISGITADATGFARTAGHEDIGAWQKTSSGSVRIANDLTGGFRERAA